MMGSPYGIYMNKMIVRMSYGQIALLSSFFMDVHSLRESCLIGFPSLFYGISISYGKPAHRVFQQTLFTKEFCK